ncbi:MAG TPA: hypothetical protein VFX92_06065, partial [Candidatus Krumholzibacteria bacterium]|nr:hypothetical protein [Candidatus Krumholzibacteria bacterium]
MRPIKVLLMRLASILVIALACIAPHAVWSQAVPSDYDPLLWSPVVVRGVIENVGPRYFTHDQLYPNGPEMENPPDAKYRVDLIEVRVTNVLKGQVSGAVFRVWSLTLDFAALLKVGQDVVLCAEQSSCCFGGAYIVPVRENIYARDGDLWIRGVERATPLPPGAPKDVFVSEPLPELSIEEIAERTERSSVPTIS